MTSAEPGHGQAFQRQKTCSRVVEEQSVNSVVIEFRNPEDGWLCLNPKNAGAHPVAMWSRTVRASSSRHHGEAEGWTLDW